MRKSAFIVFALAALAASIILMVHWWGDPSGVTPGSPSEPGDTIRPTAGEDEGAPRASEAKAAAVNASENHETPRLEIPPEIRAAQIEKVLAPHKRKRVRMEGKMRLLPNERQLIEEEIGALHANLQKIEAKSVVPLRRLRDSKGIEVVVLRLTQPSAAQILEFHAECSAMVQSFPQGASPSFEKVARAEVEAVLDSYTYYPLPNHVLALGVESDFFQVKFANSLADEEEKEQYFGYSSDDVLVFQGNIRTNEEMLTRYGYLFGLDAPGREPRIAK